MDAGELCKLSLLGCAPDDGPGSSLDEATAAGSLFCIEGSLEDCSSLEPECDEFSVYQSPDPLSLGAAGQGEDGGARGGGDDGGAAAAAPPACGVLADRYQALPPLAHDPDLREMLRWGLTAGWRLGV